MRNINTRVILTNNFMKNKKYQIGKKAYLQLPVEVKAIDKEAGTLEAIFSTQDVDRHGDTVLQEGWDLKNFKKNPVILNSHNYEDAAEVIGKASNVRVEKKKLQGTITFAVAENPKAKVIFDLYAGGFLNAFSVGFIVNGFKENKDGTVDWFTISEAELLEVSAVSVPANARALAKAKGIQVELLKTNEQNNDEPNEEPAGEPDELSEDNEVPPADEQPPTEDGNGGESEPGSGEPEPGKPTGSEESEPTVPGEENNETEEENSEPVEPEPKKASYKQRVAKALGSIEHKRKEHYKRVANITKELLNEQYGPELSAETREQLRKRKINQAIRALQKTK